MPYTASVHLRLVCVYVLRRKAKTPEKIAIIKTDCFYCKQRFFYINYIKAHLRVLPDPVSPLAAVKVMLKNCPIVIHHFKSIISTWRPRGTIIIKRESPVHKTRLWICYAWYCNEKSHAAWKEFHWSLRNDERKKRQLHFEMVRRFCLLCPLLRYFSFLFRNLLSNALLYLKFNNGAFDNNLYHCVQLWKSIFCVRCFCWLFKNNRNSSI